MRGIILGIDVGIGNNTGVAEYLPKEKKFINISSMDLFDCLNLILEYQASSDWDLIAVVENSDLDSNVYGAGEALVAYVTNVWSKISYKKNPKKNFLLLKQARKWITMGSNVGKNKGLAKTLCSKLEKLGVATVQIAPSKRDRYPKIAKFKGKPILEKGEPKEVPYTQLRMPTKLPSDLFKTLTGYNKSTNEHGRDGATMLINKSFFYWSNYARTQVVKKKKTKQ